MSAPSIEKLRAILERLGGEWDEGRTNTGEEEMRAALGLLEQAANKARRAAELARSKGLEDKAREAEARLRAIMEDIELLKRRWGVALLERAIRRAAECTQHARCELCLEAIELAGHAVGEGLVSVEEAAKVLEYAENSYYHCTATTIQKLLAKAREEAEKGNYRQALKTLDTIRGAAQLLREAPGDWRERFQGLLERAEALRRAILSLPAPTTLPETPLPTVAKPAASKTGLPEPPKVLLASWPQGTPPGLALECIPLAVVGVGGTARVYRAHCQCCPSRPVAVKVYHESVDLERAIEEARRWYMATRCPGVVEVYRVPTRDNPYLIVEYCDHSLATIEYPPRDFETLRTIVEAIASTAETLACAHTHGLAHYDIKPTNILHCNGQWKLSDWGAKPHDYTPGFAAPEQLDPETYGNPGPWTDIFQLGVTAYLLLTGTHPYGPQSEKLHDNTYKPPPPIPPLLKTPHDIAPTLPEQIYILSNTIKEMIHRDPTKRPKPEIIANKLKQLINKI